MARLYGGVAGGGGGGSVTGTGVAGQVTLWNAPTVIEGSANFTFDKTNLNTVIGTATLAFNEKFSFGTGNSFGNYGLGVIFGESNSSTGDTFGGGNFIFGFGNTANANAGNILNVIFGSGCLGWGLANFVFGVGCVGLGSYNAVFGHSNAANPASYDAVFGDSNVANSSQYAVVGGGGNTVTGDYNAVFGSNNSLTGSPYGNLIGGNSNIIAGGYAHNIIGGNSNNVVGNYNLVGGNTNSITGGSNANIIGGQSNAWAGNQSLFSGLENSVSVNFGCAVGYQLTTNAGPLSHAFIFGGRNDLQVSNSSIFGNYGLGYQPDSHTWSTGYQDSAGERGSIQSALTHAHYHTTDATPTVIGVGQGLVNLVSLDSKAYYYTIKVVARNAAAQESAAYRFEFLFDRLTGVASVRVLGLIKTVIYEDVVAWDANVTADLTNGCPSITVTGETGKHIYWVAKIEMTEVG